MIQKEIIFDSLGIDETQNTHAIKFAYKQNLDLINPEKNPEKLKKLRKAYENCKEILKTFSFYFQD
jgi:hypothetical protein